LKQSKNELGWADFRVMEYSRIEKWWEIVMSVYLMVSLQAEDLKNSDYDYFFSHCIVLIFLSLGCQCFSLPESLIGSVVYFWHLSV
jgi:SRSO17 transposase